MNKYYTGQSILDDFNENTMILFFPKKNSRIRVRRGWGEINRCFMDDPMIYLKEYFKNNASESGFTSDKRTAGDLICQKRIDRK